MKYYWVATWSTLRNSLLGLLTHYINVLFCLQGHMVLGKLWNDSNLAWSKFLSPEENEAEFIKSNVSCICFWVLHWWILVMGHDNIRIIFFYIGNSQWCLGKIRSNLSCSTLSREYGLLIGQYRKIMRHPWTLTCTITSRVESEGFKILCIYFLYRRRVSQQPCWMFGLSFCVLNGKLSMF